MRAIFVLLLICAPFALRAEQPWAIGCSDADGTHYLVPVIERDGVTFAWFSRPGTAVLKENFVLLDCASRSLLISEYKPFAPKPDTISRWFVKRVGQKRPFTIDAIQPVLERRGIPVASGRAASPLPCLCATRRSN